jgi:citrate lyase subunit beta / citryl-CoA lyase
MLPSTAINHDTRSASWPFQLAYARSSMMMTSHLLRSALYVPAANARALAKADALGADAVIIDLEDSVGPDMKETSRAALADLSRPAGLRVLRVNAAGTPWNGADVAAAMSLNVGAVLLPKVNGPDAIATLRSKVGSLPVWAMIETAAGVVNAAAIAAALGPSGVLVLGLNDLSKETGIAQAVDRAPMLAVLTQTVMAARASRCGVLDGVCNALDDDARFMAECQQGRAFGFDGKTVIHPRQIAAANSIFGPTEEEIAEARTIVAAFAAPDAVAKGVISLNGRMVERLHFEMANAVLAKVAAIASRRSS